LRGHRRLWGVREPHLRAGIPGSRGADPSVNCGQASQHTS
jgi:hypothetical protein